MRLAPAILSSVLAAAVALPALAQPVPVEVIAGVPFPLRVGGEAAIEGTSIRLRFDRVTGDSRCPIDVMCVWAGVFEMVLVVDAGGGRPATEVTLDTLGQEGTASGFHFVLLEVKPSRRASQPFDAATYAVLLRADAIF
ncbi:MAG: hypothetical protein IT534_09115 [Bauldia sp.]|nr:hypothetical protein [Bauldia sp.]